MRTLLIRAERIGKEGEVPVCAVVLNDKGHCIGHGSNQRERFGSPLGHAELAALQQASRLKQDWRFNECTLIVTLEPCTMCAAALVQARMGQVIFSAPDPKRGGLGGTINLANHQSSHHSMRVIGGVEEEAGRKLLEGWFKQRRQKQRSGEIEATLSQKD